MPRVTLILLLLLSLKSTAAAQAHQSSPIPNGQSPANERINEPSDEALIGSIKRGDLSSVLRLLENRVSADATDDGGTALCWAVRVNRADIVEALLAKKANPNKEEDDGGTPLDVAASVGRVQMVKLLLDHGAHVNHKDEGGHTALLYASFGSTLKNAPEWLARSFFEIEENGDDLMASMGTEHLAVVELLLTAGADVNAQAEDCGLTGLMVAAMGGNVELAKILLAHHVDVATGNGEWNALRFAEQFGSPQEIQTQLQELETEEAKQAYFNWVQFTAPGRQTISKMLRKAGAGKSSSGGLK